MDKPIDPSKSFARIDLPIRDVLRFIIPGGYGAISGALIDHLLFHDALGLANSSLLVPAGFIFGLIAFVGSFHSRLRPWKRRWHRELDAIAKEINAIKMLAWTDDVLRDANKRNITSKFIDDRLISMLNEA